MRGLVVGWVLLGILAGCGGRSPALPTYDEEASGGTSPSRGGTSGAAQDGSGNSSSGDGGSNAGAGGATAGASGSTNGGAAGAAAGTAGDGGTPGDVPTITIIEPFPPDTTPDGAATDVAEQSLVLWGLSDDGSVLAGQCSYIWGGLNSIYLYEPVVWTRATGLVRMGTFPGVLATDVQPLHVSPDGSAVFGTYFRRPDATADISERTFAGFFRWTQSTGLMSFGATDHYVFGGIAHVSRDGRTVQGELRTADDFSTPFLWTAQGDMRLLLSTSGWPAGGEVRAMSSDASVLLVSSDPPTSVFRWTDAGVENLGKLPGAAYCVGTRMTPDASVILGQCTDDEEQSPGKRLFRWTREEGFFEYDFTADDGYATSDAGTVALRFDGTTLHRWTPNGTTTTALPNVGSVSTDYHLMGLSPDASTGYGYLLPQNDAYGGTTWGSPGTEAFRLDEASGVARLGFLRGHDASEVKAASRDGLFLTGSSWPRREAYDPILTEATLWDSQGIRDIRAEMDAAGIDLTDITLAEGTHVWSGSPITVFGNGTKGATRVWWVATLPQRR